MKLPRAILADDHKILVEAFRKLLEPYCEVVATVSDGRTLLDVAATLKPDLIVLDIGMPILNGLEAGRQLKHRSARCTVVAQLPPNCAIVLQNGPLNRTQRPDSEKQAVESGNLLERCTSQNVHRGFESSRSATFGWPTYEVIHFQGSASRLVCRAGNE
jgi:CheY-like chemotaxis protein